MDVTKIFQWKETSADIFPFKGRMPCANFSRGFCVRLLLFSAASTL